MVYDPNVAAALIPDCPQYASTGKIKSAIVALGNGINSEISEEGSAIRTNGSSQFNTATPYDANNQGALIPGTQIDYNTGVLTTSDYIVYETLIPFSLTGPGALAVFRVFSDANNVLIFDRESSSSSTRGAVESIAIKVIVQSTGTGQTIKTGVGIIGGGSIYTNRVSTTAFTIKGR